MSNLRILARNLADTATLTAAPACVETGGLTAANLQKQTERGRTARTTSLASQDMKLSWPTAQKANMIAFTRHNWTTAATLQALLYSGVDWTSSIYAGSALNAFSTAGLNTDIDIYTESDFAMLRNSAQYFAEVTTMKSAIARIADAANPDGYIEQTRLWIGKYFELSTDPGYGAVEMTLMDDSKSARADDGSQIVNKNWKARRLSINLEFVNDTDLPSLLAIERYLGLDKECFVSLYPGDGGAKELYHMMACRIVSSPSLGPVQFGVHKNSLVFEET